MVSSLPFLLVTLVAAPSQAPANTGDSGAALLRDALALRARGDLAAAAALLSPDKGAPAPGYCGGGPLEPWCALQRAQVLFWAGRPSEAAADFAAARALDPAGPAGRRALSGEGEARFQAGEVARGLPLLEEAARQRPGPETLLLLAQARLAAGKHEDAVAALTRLYLEHPETRPAREAGRKLEQLRAFDRITSAEHVARSARLAAWGYGRKALASAKRAQRTARTELERLTAAFAEGKALAALRQHAEAEEALAVVAEQARDALRVQALAQRAKSALARDEIALALERFDALVRDHPGDPAAEEAAFMAAWTFFNRGDWRGCAERFSALSAGQPAARRADDTLWYLGLCSRLSGDSAAALDAFSRLERLSPKLAPQAAYWRARTLSSPKEAEAIYRSIIRASPVSWYAWHARARLGELGAAAEPWRLAAREPSAIEPQTVREHRARLLMDLGMRPEASEELAADEQAARKDPARAAAFAASLGLYDRAYKLANAHLWGKAYRDGDPGALGLLYPRAHGEIVRPSAAAVDFDPYFVWAIMRRESAFDPLATSVARALGLMQLLQPTARKIALLAGEPRPTLAEMQTPERLVPLAAWYLSDLAGRFGHAALAAAAYNGGPGPVASWVQKNGDRPLDEFVELIPYKETRLYVKGVLGDYFAYRALWGEQGEPLPFPTKVPPAEPGATF